MTSEMLSRSTRAFLVQRVAAQGASPAGILLALRLFDLAPCPVCGFVHDRCRCLPAAGTPNGDSDG